MECMIFISFLRVSGNFQYMFNFELDHYDLDLEPSSINFTVYMTPLIDARSTSLLLFVAHAL